MEKKHVVNIGEERDCQLCMVAQADFDARVPSMAWAYVCQFCFEFYGCKTGVGHGVAITWPGKKD